MFFRFCAPRVEEGQLLLSNLFQRNSVYCSTKVSHRSSIEQKGAKGSWESVHVSH
jgi:hypothetical protein